MLKIMMLSLGMLLGSQAFASSAHNLCVNSLQYHYLASSDEAINICDQDATPQFVQCMERKARVTNLDMAVVAPSCSKKVKVASAYNTCEAQMQINAGMSYDRALQMCQWDPSRLMQGCLIDLVQYAGFHPQHAIQYCSFASQNYRSAIPFFKSCVVAKSRKGYGVQASVQACHNKILGIVEVEVPDHHQGSHSVKPYPRSEPETKVTPKVVEQQQPKSEPSESITAPPQAPKNKTGISPKVPIPVEIKVQESSRPQMEDQPLDSESTSNAESLPI